MFGKVEEVLQNSGISCSAFMNEGTVLEIAVPSAEYKATNEHC